MASLRGVQRVLGRPAFFHGDALIKDVESLLEIDCSGLREAWSLKRGQISPGKKEVPRLMERYLENLDRLVLRIEEHLSQGTR
jgi:hypothetical protein